MNQIKQNGTIQVKQNGEYCNFTEAIAVLPFDDTTNNGIIVKNNNDAPLIVDGNNSTATDTAKTAATHNSTEVIAVLPIDVLGTG